MRDHRVDQLLTEYGREISSWYYEVSGAKEKNQKYHQGVLFLTWVRIRNKPENEGPQSSEQAEFKA